MNIRLNKGLKLFKKVSLTSSSKWLRSRTFNPIIVGSIPREVINKSAEFWNPFTANISEECELAIKERNFRKKKSKIALNLMFSMALGLVN